jgi:urea transporter
MSKQSRRDRGWNTAMAGKKSNFLIACLHGTSQVFFMENVATGAFFFAAIAYTSYASVEWVTTIGAAIGIVVATLTAQFLEADEGSVTTGLYGFNGVLVGVALPTFIAASPQLWVSVVVGAATSTVFTAAFSATLTKAWGIPGSTGPFVLTGWLMVAGAYSFGVLEVTGDAPRLGSDYIRHLVSVPSPVELVQIFFRNIGQVLLLGSAVSGAIVLLGIFIASIPAGIAVVVGSIIAMVVSILMGANPSAVSAGLYGFSPVLTALAVGVVFLKPSVRVLIYAALATVMTVFVQGALDAIMQPSGLPSFTAPYVLTMYLFVAPKKLLTPHPHKSVAGHMVTATGKTKAGTSGV